MTKDVRYYAKFTLDFADHPKILALSFEAKWALVELTLWSRKHMTDGVIAKRLASSLASASAFAELCANDAHQPSLIETDDAYIIHDFSAHQDTRAEIEARSNRARIAGQKGGRPRKQPAKQPAKRNESKQPSEMKAEKEKHIKKETKKDSTYSMTFERWWSTYPRKVAKRAAAVAYDRVVKGVDACTLQTAVEAYAASVADSEQKFIAHPTTWLNQGRWEDQAAAEAPSVEEFLRDCWRRGVTAKITELTGHRPDPFRWPDEPIPADFDQEAARVDQVRAWLEREHDTLVESLSRGNNT